jgi:predicted enzyme related to lactoylglutathione lyase
MPSSIAALAIDAIDVAAVADFWCAVLGWAVVEQWEGGTSIGPASGGSMTIDVMSVPEHKTVKNRLHLDIRAHDTSTAEELQRLLGLGARRADVGQGPDVSWVVLADPEGNEFCLLSRTVEEVASSG